jgi:hypothetical protein
MAIFAQMSGSLWTESDASALSAGYIVHHVPGQGEGRAKFKAHALQELLLAMEGLAVSPGTSGE